MPSNGYKLTMAEFKGQVLEKLSNIEKRMDENSKQHKEFYTRIRNLERKPSFSLNPGAWLATALGFKK